MDMNALYVELRVGGKIVKVPPLTLRTLKMAWPIIARLGATGDEQATLDTSTAAGKTRMMELHAERVGLIAKVMASAAQSVDPTMTLDRLENELTYPETLAMPTTYNELLELSGLNKDPTQPTNGANPPGDLTPSTETSTGLLPN